MKAQVVSLAAMSPSSQDSALGLTQNSNVNTTSNGNTASNGNMTSNVSMTSDVDMTSNDRQVDHAGDKVALNFRK